MASIESCFMSSFTRDIGLSQYESRFFLQGYENFIDLVLIDGKDLDVLDICNRNHRQQILRAVDDLSVDMWLKAFNLECHIKNFYLHNIKTISNLRNTNIDDTLLEKLEIKTPGHRKRLNICVQLLQTSSHKETAQMQDKQHGGIQKGKEQVASSEMLSLWHPSAVAIGYWNRPAILPNLSHDFLCVKGNIKAGPEDSNQSDCLEFLVDSASDVITARMEIITRLGLEFLQTIESHGVHSVADKPLYRGYLRLGKSEWMMVEVQPEEYESVGSTVIKKFFHFINGTFHQWIPKGVQHSDGKTS